MELIFTMAEDTKSATSMVTLAQHHPEFAKQVIFTDAIVEMIRRYLLTEQISKDGKSWERIEDSGGNKLKPLMEESFAHELSSSLRPTISQFLLLTRQEKEEVNNMIEITADDIDTWLALNWKKANISPENYYSDLISDALINLIQSVAKASQDGSLQEFFKKTIATKEIIDTGELKKKSLISLPTFFTREVK